MHPSPIARTLSATRIGHPVTCESLAMYPLLASAAGALSAEPLDYDTLDDALDAGFVEITEVSEQGRVPELRLVSTAPTPTLIVDGQELTGAKQNRVVNLTILVAARSELTIPVSCVEAGRWRARSRTFAAAPRTQYAAGRARRMAQVTSSLRASGTYIADQSAVWADIADKAARLRSHSPTGAMETMFVDHAAFINTCVQACAPVDGQVGALFAINDAIVGVDLFDREATLRKLLPKLVRSVALDALDRPAAGEHTARSIDTPQPQTFVEEVGRAAQHRSPAIGMGEDVRLTAPGVTGAALVVGDHVVHLSAFAIA